MLSMSFIVRWSYVMVELVRNNEIYAISGVGNFSIVIGQIELILGQNIINFFLTANADRRP